mmetsp:Transcript_53686/g.109424  ORF Transcript_53686/g.109424 Transcript_53686/m.109424 type:complete len:210 (+) Transcript_53686:450-1079(+)
MLSTRRRGAWSSERTCDSHCLAMLRVCADMAMTGRSSFPLSLSSSLEMSPRASGASCTGAACRMFWRTLDSHCRAMSAVELERRAGGAASSSLSELSSSDEMSSAACLSGSPSLRRVLDNQRRATALAIGSKSKRASESESDSDPSSSLMSSLVSPFGNPSPFASSSSWARGDMERPSCWMIQGLLALKKRWRKESVVVSSPDPPPPLP